MARKKTNRDDDLSSRPKVRERLLEIFKEVDEGFVNQRSRSDEILDFWDAYNCVLGSRQIYNGNSKIYVPIIRDAIEARKTRFVNQLFPQSGRNIDVISEDGEIPHAMMSLIEHYIRAAKLRTQVVNTLLVNGDVEGQYTVYIDWSQTKRHVARRVTEGIKIDGLEHPELEEIEKIEHETLEEGCPRVELINDVDFLVSPATVDSLDEALEIGGSITVIRRWTKAKIKRLIADGDIDEESGETLLSAMNKKESPSNIDTSKELADQAGIKKSATGKIATIYETWARLKVDGEMRLCRAYYGGQDQILGCKLNPNWNDRCPVISAPVKKLPGVFKGISNVKAGVLDIQVAANDAINEGMDSAAYALLPIIMTDPEKNPRVGSLVMDLAAVWEVDPKSTQFAQFPQLWKEAFAIVNAAKQEIFQSLSVNPSMMPQQTGGKAKRNQAEIANEQQVDILTTADAVSNLEMEIMTPLVQWFMELDSQHRDDDILVKSFGDMGRRAVMEAVPPLQMNKRWWLRWFGVEAARNAAQIQQQIATINVLRGIPPQQYEGYKLNLVPVIEQIVENAFGPRLAPLIFVSLRDQMTVDPETENQMLADGHDVAVHAGDDDPEHLKSHSLFAQTAGGDPSGAFRVHIQKHMMQMQAKLQQQAQQQGGQPGVPGGAGPGVAGTPRPGGQPAQPKMKGPPGAINPDQMPAAGAVGMPRKM